MFLAIERRYSVTVCVVRCFHVDILVNVLVMMDLVLLKNKSFMDAVSLVVRSENSVSIPVRLLVILVSRVPPFLACSMWWYIVLVVDVARLKSVSLVSVGILMCCRTCLNVLLNVTASVE